MLYIRPTPTEDASYTPPQSLKVKGLVNFPEKFLENFNMYNGFVYMVIEDNTVVAITPNVEAWEAWKAEKQETETENAELLGSKHPEPVTWEDLDKAYNEGRDGAYDI